MFENRQVRSGTPAPRPAPAGTKPYTAIHVIPMEQYAVQYADLEGNLHETVFVKVGNMLYEPIGAEDWAGKLRPVREELAKSCSVHITSKAAPAKDDVDVVGSPA
jgi:hypothetical protein